VKNLCYCKIVLDPRDLLFLFRLLPIGARGPGGGGSIRGQYIGQNGEKIFAILRLFLPPGFFGSYLASYLSHEEGKFDI
jgi:hypothetical protein